MNREQMIHFIKSVRRDDPDIDAKLWALSTEAIKAMYKLEVNRIEVENSDRVAEMGL